MGSPIALDCVNCGESFQAVRITAKYCGGTCRQQFNRRVNGLAEGPAENLKIKVEISRVSAVVKSLRKKFSLEDLITSDLTGELQDAFDSLDEVVNPLCENCEKPADGWDGILLARTAENLKIKVEISRVSAVVKSLRKKFSLEDLITSDLTGELQDAFDSLDEVVNPLCENCEKPADGWDEILLCRRCEITIHDMYCGSCEIRRPSVKSDIAFCLKCEKGES